MDYYWNLVTRDGVSLLIAPENVAKVNKHLADRTPIAVKGGTILPHEIASFRVTSQPFNQQPLLDAASHAFREAQVNKDGGIVARWVKKAVTGREWTSYYSKNPGYKKLGDDGAHVEVAFLQPLHEVDLQVVDYCSDEEISRLERGR